MSSVTPAAPATEAAQAWVGAFAEGWLAPASADAFADHFQPWFDPHIRLIQPQLPTLVGHRAFRERFARPLFALIPDLHGQVERFAVGADCAYVELTLRGTLGGRPVAWRACDRATLRAGLVVERESYFDPLPLLRAVLTRPRAWPALARTQLRQMRQRPHRATSRNEHNATAGRAPARPPTDRRPGRMTTCEG
jgi:ketosteroid isomerase-like protein